VHTVQNFRVLLEGEEGEVEEEGEKSKRRWKSKRRSQQAC
jgi:hypothetical protein